MRRRRTTAVAALAVALASLVVVRDAGSALPPGWDYAWVQPGCAPVVTPYAQPPAWIPIAAAEPAVPGAGYAWEQPGCAPVSTPDAQPPV